MGDFDVAIIGCGFVGSSLARYLNKKYNVVTFDVVPQPETLNAHNIRHVICDIRDKTELSQKLGNPKIIIHTAIIQIPRITEEKQLGYDVNVLGTQHICEIVSNNPAIKGLILCDSWHVFGEQELNGIITEDFGYRPDKIEDRARLYAISKIMQECIIRFFDEKTPNKIFGAIRLGTVLGEGMPKATAANLFIEKAVKGEEITPFKHVMYRPMFYVSISDVCKSFESYINLIFSNKKNNDNSLNHIINLAYEKPITILDLATYVKDAVHTFSDGKISSSINIIDKGIESVYDETSTTNLKIDNTKLHNFLQINSLSNPKNIISELVRKKLSLN